MKTQDQFESVSQSAAVVGIVASTVIVVIAMESTLVGSAIFGAVSVFAIALPTAAILGWNWFANANKNAAKKQEYQLGQAA